MKKIFKKNQIIIATLAVMIAVAGYLNYSGRLFGEADNGTAEANADLANQELLDISQEDARGGCTHKRNGRDDCRTGQGDSGTGARPEQRDAAGDYRQHELK